MSASALHHVSIIAGNARQNYQFYTDVLGMRLVKCTVNFEDPTAYHLYFGDEAGTPGSLVTFFPWENIAPGRLGVGEVQETVLRVPDESLGFWMHRFLQKGVVHDSIERRFGRSTLPFRDPHGTRLALVSTPDIQHTPAFTGGKVPVEHAVRGLHSVSLLVEEEAPTAAILTDVFGYQRISTEGSTSRYGLAGDPAASIIDIRAVGGFLKPRPGGGSVHHIAFRARDEAEQAAMTEKLEHKFGLQPTEVKDRKYFKSVYFREPGHILFEIATDKPGMMVDETEAGLGSALMLPDGYEPMRESIEANLPAFR
ncbi:ring-cleaving dioxygenase [Aureimonas fodinaquatilis]|uniref:Ring-cleaving dioxygenase n=1 Tax=Aureimonas fodinaquatilis TaxID=2565783 RepID=A0A5B0DZ59_9HYPH|nr:ring-cleaving dioxygenase [Aureimonas fodinaquatilis]KAA0972107.1 ring-cleaving dioxygenase [Aureimonas fodinaquatilis]